MLFDSNTIMMITENLLIFFRCSSLLIFLLIFPQRCCCMNHHICTPSSCGKIHNISFPFRLKHDPKHCGYPDYELACENDVTLIHLNSQKYRVKAINYHNLTISLVDVSIKKSSTCYFPNHSAYENDFTRGPYSTHEAYISLRSYHVLPDVALPINFMSCPQPLHNSSFLTNICANGNGTRFNYMKIGHMNASDVKYMCRVDQIVMTSWKFQDLKNVSISEIHDSLLYGFELSWFRYPCSKCKDTSSCYIDENRTATCNDDWPIELPEFVVIIIGIAVGNSLIVGFAVFVGVLILVCWKWYFTIYNFAVGFVSIQETIGIGLAGIRLIIVLPGLLWLLMYKFRRRHSSMFNEIEDFLQGDNKLMPIRYSYSDIKMMTRGFREKLGQGGYGSVYKGKLRSGRDVAVKVLGNPGGNDQDFMNEIATIGRIHHVNVIELVGYCAERSKRALIFDFMPKGSLEKYIFIQDGVNSLNWEMKYEIAVGVARGIEYLHRGCDIQILHFDIKPHNILLDDMFIPKISDFRLAKFYSTEKKTVTLTAVRGTIGYVAPELINRGFGRVSYKADVYSFGMLLIDMVCLKKDLRGNDEKSSQYFPDWIYDCFDQGRDVEIGEIDEKNEEDKNGEARKIARKMTIVALWCIQMSPDNRPSMNKVLEMLEGEVEHLQIPQRPTQSSQFVFDGEQSLSSTDSISLLPRNDAPSFEITVQAL